MLIQDMVPVEQSKVWQLLHDFYVQRGPEAWSKSKVPLRVTSNACIADVYAALVAEMLRELRNVSKTKPPLILELGGGNGQFAWLFMQRLLKYHWQPEDGEPNFTYLLTDAASGNLEHWQKQPRFSRFVEQGLLQFGLATISESTKIQVGTTTLTSETLADRPLVIIANYMFDTLPTDLYRVREGKLHRVLMSLESDDPAILAGKPETFSTLQPHYSAEEVAHAQTGNPLLDKIIDSYVDVGRDMAIPVPRIGFSFLQSFMERSAPLLLLAGDLAYTNPLSFPTKPPFLFENFFAQYTNFHAFAALFEHHGGNSQFQRHPDPNFTAAAFWLPGNGAVSRLERMPAIARTQLQDFAPGDANEVNDLLEESVGNASFGQLFAWLRMARFDPHVAQTCLPFFVQAFHLSDEGLDRQMLRDVYLEAYELLLPDGSEVTFDYEIAQLLLVLRFDDDALRMLQSSLVEFGRSPERLYIYALCLLRLTRPEEAKQVLNEALAQRSDFAAARQVFEEHFGGQLVKDRKTNELARFTLSCSDTDVVPKAQALLAEHGVVLLQNMFPRGYLDRVRESFMDRFENWKDDEMGQPNSVGNKRYTVPLRIQPPFSDPALFANDTLMQIIKNIQGEEPIVNAYGGVVTYPGANSQHVHREHPLLFSNDEFNVGLPAHAINILVPLVDLDEQLGGTQVWEGTHRLGNNVRWSGPSRVFFAQKGDAIVMDYRTYHGGMPCISGDLRPVLFITYSLPWFRDTMAFESHDAVAISRSELAAIPSSHRAFFRFARRINDKASVASVEVAMV